MVDEPKPIAQHPKLLPGALVSLFLRWVIVVHRWTPVVFFDVAVMIDQLQILHVNLPLGYLTGDGFQSVFGIHVDSVYSSAVSPYLRGSRFFEQANVDARFPHARMANTRRSCGGGQFDGTEECKVTFRDTAGIEHTVTVRAINRFHAFGQALAKMKHCSWSNPEHRCPIRMAVELIQMGKKWRRVYVTTAQFEAWLGQQDSSGQRHRDYVKMLLGRMPPDRDFKNGMRR